MAEIAVGQVIAGAQALTRAGCWELAGQLLAAARTHQPREQTAIALAMAEVAVDQDYWCRTGRAEPVLDRAAEAVAQSADGSDLYDLDFLRLRQDYVSMVSDSGEGPPAGGPNDRSPALQDQLERREERLRGSAPDRLRGGWASLYAGLIAQVLRNDAATAGPLFAEALAAADRRDDEAGALLGAAALHHLGAIAREAGDTRRARFCLERSAELRRSARFVPGLLAVQLALAELAKSEGENARARALASEVRRWARALHIGWLQSAAAQICEPPHGIIGADRGEFRRGQQ